MHALQTPAQAAQWLRTVVSGDLHSDSRKVGTGDAFIAWPGAAVDGRSFITQAFAQGASACLMQQEGSQAWAQLELTDRVATLPQLKQLTGSVAAAYYEHPSQAVQVLAITGTNGKTSTACWLAQCLNHPAIAKSCGVVGTLGVGVWPDLQATGMTTPDPVLLQRSLHRMRQLGTPYCALEASSIGLAEHRLDGTQIHTAIFTNFTQDHLDYHPDMAAYWQAKRRLFSWTGLKSVVINIDDPQGAQLAQEIRQEVAQAAASAAIDVWTCSRRQEARLRAHALPNREGLSFQVCEGSVCVRIDSPLIGAYNIDNLLGVIGALRAQGLSLTQIALACADLQAVPGRMQKVQHQNHHAALPVAVVDYAHTPDALNQALQALQPLARERGGQLWCVVGCGGDRDPHKRPLMAAVAQAQADHVVLTSDNPRSESPQTILEHMVAGLQEPHAVTVEPDRSMAIARAVRQAQPEDVVLVAGKGHESTQEIAGVFHPFSDVTHLQAALSAKAAMQEQVT